MPLSACQSIALAHNARHKTSLIVSIGMAFAHPRLPPELETRIFQMAALSRPTCIPSLMLVARRVKFWVEPLLYHVVFLSSAVMDEARLPSFTADSIPYDCFRHVRHLLIDQTSSNQTEFEKWLLACTGATNLFAQFDCTPEILPLLSGFINIRYLTVDVRALLGTTVPLPLFLTVTHLELLNYTHKSVDRASENISLIPHLTHLALNSRLQLSSRWSHATLCANTQLQCIVFLSPVISLEGSPLLDDSRFVCIDERINYHSDWLHGAIFGEDYWSLADAFLTARRAGEIDRSRYRIVNGGDFKSAESADDDSD
ncbi:hypothetical protein MSAN_00485500 [Mycena sanguinolenta]|uniref:Uncharacterized protein n=1 Tax=Mycena sanguinolenta TaxID=230812 RepID=A0A8H6Z8D6_9AGAR|nr:hypothetical protein MSAN_00485500 [Mycena sanguinolenta]